MLKHIEKLQARPKHERRQIAFVVAVGLFVGIASIWAYSLPKLNVDNNQEITTNESNVDTPFETLKSIFSSTTKSINEVIKNGPPQNPLNDKSL